MLRHPWVKQNQAANPLQILFLRITGTIIFHSQLFLFHKDK